MQAFKELYWRYSLFVLILGLGVTIFIELTPFLGGVLGAMTIYVLLRRQMHYLTACRKWRRSLAASLLLGEAVLCFLVPISLIVWMVVNQVQDIALAPESVVEPLKHIAALIHDKTGYNLWQEKNITSLVGVIPRLGQWVLGSIMDSASTSSCCCSCSISCSSAACAWKATAARYCLSTGTWAAASCARCT